jgi:hypothetical protein
MQKDNEPKKGQAVEPPREIPTESEPAGKVDLDEVSTRIISLVGKHALTMVGRTIEEAENGHYLAMKCLFELIGLCPATAPQGAMQEDSLAKTLLQRLRFPEGTDSGSDVTKEYVANRVEQESDAVK